MYGGEERRWRRQSIIRRRRRRSFVIEGEADLGVGVRKRPAHLRRAKREGSEEEEATPGMVAWSSRQRSEEGHGDGRRGAPPCTVWSVLVPTTNYQAAAA